MKLSLIALCVGFIVLGGLRPAHGAEDRVFVYETTGDRDSVGRTNQWWLPHSRVKRLPKWHSSETQPPLSLKAALKKAKRWIDARGGGDVEEVVLRPIGRNDGEPYRNIYFYRIRYGVSPFLNHLTCIVLMDGTVLEPESHPDEYR